MPTETEILAALQNDTLAQSNPINDSASAPYVITYQFENSDPSDEFSGLYTGYQAWTAAEKAAVNAQLAYIETLINVDFVEVTGNSDPTLNLGRVQLDSQGTWVSGEGGTGIAYNPSTTPYTVVDIDAIAVYDVDSSILTDYGTNLVLHELGHALGMVHPFSGTTLPSAYENNHYTVMSYTADSHSSGAAGGGFNAAFMLYDVLTLQSIWGTAENEAGDTVYTGPRTVNVDTVWDTGGTDAFDASGETDFNILDLRAGRYSTFGTFEDVAIAYGVTIENAIGGSGRDRIFGNDVTNTLNGGRGKDTLIGNGGDDTLLGKSGQDRLEGGDGNDTLNGGSGDDIQSGGDGHDTLLGAAGHDTLDGDKGRDELRGGGGNDRLTGGDANDTLYGNAGRDNLRGGKGIDTMFGGSGNDLLRGHTGVDTATGGGGADTFIFVLGDDALIVTDFTAGEDTLRLKGFDSAILGSAAQVGDDVTLSHGGDTVTLLDVTLSAVQSDFHIA